MNHPETARQVKIDSIVEMSQGYSAMTRVFSRGSSEEIVKQLGSFFKELEHVTRQEEYDAAHAAFCRWFERSITMAGKTERACSYGHAAKVLDIAAKVYVYYCARPSPEAAEKLIPMLHGGLDTAMTNYLRRKYPSKGIRARNVVGVDLDEYNRLQESVAEDIRSQFDSQIHPVQWDDIMFRRLNRKSRPSPYGGVQSELRRAPG